MINSPKMIIRRMHGSGRFPRGFCEDDHRGSALFPSMIIALDQGGDGRSWQLRRRAAGRAELCRGELCRGEFCRKSAFLAT
jgi:hypothetical protein